MSAAVSRSRRHHVSTLQTFALSGDQSVLMFQVIPSTANSATVSASNVIFLLLDSSNVFSVDDDNGTSVPIYDAGSDLEFPSIASLGLVAHLHACV